MILKGLKLGMLLQLAIGPITLLVVQITAISGITKGLMAVLGVTSGDGLFVLAAILGVGALIKGSEKTKRALSLVGAVIMITFGGMIVVESLGLTFVPRMPIAKMGGGSAFFKTLIITVANPMTILFWAGVFATKIVEENMMKRDMVYFGVGAVLSTFIVQTCVVFLSHQLAVFLTPLMMTGLNMLVGCVLIWAGYKLLYVKDHSIIDEVS